MKTQTVKEYLNDPKRCEETLNNLVSLTYPEMEKLVDVQNRSIVRELVNPQVDVENLDSAAVRRMDYLDILRLIDNIRDNEFYGDYYDEDDPERGTYSAYDEYQYHVAMLFSFLQAAKKNSETVRRFFRMPLKALATALESNVNTGEVMATFEDFIGDYQEAGWVDEGNRDSVTVEKILDVSLKYLSRRWLPAQAPIGEYESNIRSVLNYTGKLLIDFFKLAYPKRFAVNEVRRQCRRDIETIDRMFAECRVTD